MNKFRRTIKKQISKAGSKKNSLVSNWAYVLLSDIAQINPSKPKNYSELHNMDVSFVPMKNVSEMTGVINLSETRKYHTVRKGYTYFEDNDIIFAKITPCMENGKIAITSKLKNGMGFGSTEFHVIRLLQILSRKFYFYYLIQNEFRNSARQKMKGTAGQLRVPSRYLEEIYIPLPPLNEQCRIVAKIESIFAEIDAVQEKLERLTSQTRSATGSLAQLKNSVLRQAFEGKLVSQDSTDEPIEKSLKKIYKKSVNQLIIKNYTLPDGWIQTDLENISTIILGQSPPSSTYNKEKKGLPFFQGKIDFGQLYPTPRIWCDSPKKIAKKNDILISVRAPVGSTNISIETCCIGRGLSIIRTLEVINTMYVFHQLRYLKKYISQKGTGTTFKAITGKQLKSIQIDLPPLAEQKRIVAKIESIFSRVDAECSYFFRFCYIVRSGMAFLNSVKHSSIVGVK